MNYPRFIASLISALSEPMVLVMALLVLGGWHAGLRGGGFFWYIAYLAVLSLLVWAARLRLVRTLRTNWDISERPKRVRVLILLLGFSVLLFLSFRIWDSPGLMSLSLQLMAWLLGFFLISLKTKISGHMAVLTLMLGYLYHWYGAMTVPLFMFLLPVGWSRLVLNRHTPIEVIGGILYSAAVLFFLW